MSEELEAIFPNLRNGHYEIKSPQTRKYNCIAWAIGDTRLNWSPVDRGMGYYWPWRLPRGITIDCYVTLFESLGYEICENEQLQSDFEKVAIYVDEKDSFTHVARQLETGNWTNKLGGLEDIEHNTLEALSGFEGDSYGIVKLILRKPRCNILPYG